MKNHPLFRGLLMFFTGVLFALGLGVSGMTRPDVVASFLDLSGLLGTDHLWNPSLAFVMGGAAGSYFIFYRWVLKRPMPLFATKFQLPTRKDIDGRLVLGSMIFGLGWGLGGICPGPGLVAMMSFDLRFVAFATMMVVGMLVFRTWEQRNSR